MEAIKTAMKEKNQQAVGLKAKKAFENHSGDREPAPGGIWQDLP